MKINSLMKITRRNAVLCVLCVVFVLSLPIYVFWAIFNYRHLCEWEAKFCGFIDKKIIKKQKQCRQRKMNNYCKKCRLRDGCMRKCNEAEVYEQGYNDGVSDGYNVAVDALTPNEQQPKLIIKIDGLKK